MATHRTVWIFKPVGYTPAECVDYIRSQNPLMCEIGSNYRMAFSGRLDPMACGILPLVIAPKEKIGEICERYQCSTKTYTFSMYNGIQTDTYDILGISAFSNGPRYGLEEVLNQKVQKYPVYSSRTIKDPKSGKMRKLFEFAKEGRIDEIKHLIPEHPMEIYSLKRITAETIKGSKMLTDIFDAINKLSEKSKGEFRVNEIKESWSAIIDPEKNYTVDSFEASVSSGTYIRGLANDMGGTAFNICRTKLNDFEYPMGRIPLTPHILRID